MEGLEKRKRLADLILYGCGFVDLDGHRWSVLFMDMNKMPGR